PVMDLIIFSLALGPHPQRELTLMPRLGFSGLGSAWPQALLSAPLFQTFPPVLLPGCAARLIAMTAPSAARACGPRGAASDTATRTPRPVARAARRAGRLRRCGRARAR